MCANDSSDKVPYALFNSKALFNPYQYKPFTKIMQWDQDQNQWKWNGKNLLITDEVGVGKTFEVGMMLQELLKQNSDLTVLVFCPVKLCSNWEKEMRENFYLSFSNWRKTKRMGQLTILPYSYFSKEKSHSSAEIEDVETLLEEQRAETVLLEENKKTDDTKESFPEYDILILDEAHYIRNRDSKLYAYIEKMIDQNEKEKKKLKIFLTATPIFNKEEDYDTITCLLEKGQTFQTTRTLQGEANCYDFQLEIAMQKAEMNNSEKAIIGEISETTTDENGNDRKKYGKLSGFLNRIAASSFYSLKCFVENRAEFDDIYDDSLDGTEKDGLDDLKKYCDAWERGVREEDGDSKWNAFITLLKGIKKEPTEPFKAIVFSCFLDTCAYLKKRLEQEYSVYTITGKMNPKQMEHARSAFEAAKEPAILICSDAAKEGQNLQFCQYLIHYDFPYTPAAMGQRNGRIYRKGQEGNPKVYYMFTEGTYDERLFGEIIVTKTAIVEELSNNQLVSELNVLPKDSANYMKKCIKAYFDDLVQKSEAKTEKEKSTFNMILKKQFFRKTEEGPEGKWILPEAEKCYKAAKSNGICDYANELVKIFQNSTNEIQGKQLKEYYEKQYKEEFKNWIKLFVGDYAEDQPEKKFEEWCEEYVGTIGKQKFCHHMMHKEQNDMLSLCEYRDQFQPFACLKKRGIPE